MEIISSKTKFDFMGKKYIAFLLSLIVIVASFYEWFATGSEKFGIDYTGGHEVVVKIGGEADSEGIRKALKDGGIAAPIVQAFESEQGEYSIRVGGEEESAKVRQSIMSALKNQYSSEIEIIKTDFVGPTIGQELRRKALIAVIVGLIGILGYITYRFEFAFALGAVAALFHDVVVAIGVYLLLGQTISVATLAAALTVVGYSVNDTIIVFDRMREEIFKRQKYDLIEVMNFSINVTLSRTIITSLSTLFAAASLLIFGGGAIADLSLFLVIGVITGTYSTIFIASPVALAWEDFRSRRVKE